MEAIFSIAKTVVMCFGIAAISLTVMAVIGILLDPRLGSSNHQNEYGYDPDDHQ